MNARASSHSMVMCLVTVSPQRVVASTRKATWAMRTMRSLSDRSTIAPAGMVKSRIGMDDAVATSPTKKALSVSSSASQPCAIVCTHVPIRDSVCPIRKSRKLRCLRTTRNGLIVRGTVTFAI